MSLTYFSFWYRGALALPWDAELRRLIVRYSVNKEYQTYDLVHGLSVRGLFKRWGTKQTRSIGFIQSMNDYIESFHGRNGFSRDRMTEDAARNFGASVRHPVAPCSDGHVRLSVTATVVWERVVPT